MRKILAFFLAFIVTFFVLPVSNAASAKAGSFVDRESSPTIFPEEESAMIRALDSRGLYGRNLSIEPLFDANDESSFLLGVTELGYAIMERRSLIVFECGSSNPFANFEPHKKYYGGVLSYYVMESGSTNYFNIISGNRENLPSLFSFSYEPRRDHVIDDPGNGGIFKVDNKGFITKYAFGFNVSGTCNQVACGIALNYIKRQYGLPVITYDMMPELINKGLPGSPAQNEGFYPKAETLHQRLHHFFVYSVNLTWGATYCQCVNDYLNITVSQSSSRPELCYAYHPSYSKIRQEISASKPVIVSTWHDPIYENHTMVAYGCRSITSNGNTTYELLVHAGWYGDTYFSKIGNQYFLNELWLNMSTISFGYFFILPSS